MLTSEGEPSYGRDMAVVAGGRDLCVRTGVRMGVRCLTANLVGALFVFTYLEFLAPGEVVNDYTSLSDTITFAVFLLISVALGAYWGQRTYSRDTHWLKEERLPDAAEQRRVLRLPAVQAAQSGLFWLVAAFFFGLGSLGYGHSAAHSIKIIGTILLGGLASWRPGRLLATSQSRAASFTGSPITVYS